jgi:hypothetical protein
MDIREGLKRDEQSSAVQQAVVEKHTVDVAEDLAQAIRLLLDFPNVEVSPASIEILRSVPESARSELNLGVARVLAGCGESVSNRIDQILKTVHGVSKEDIELVNQAMELGVGQDDQHLISAGLSHEFARCRVTAMNAMFSTLTAPLPSTLLDMRRDSSSLVRKRLVDMLEEKPHDNHTEALIDLTFDTWTPDQHHHEYAVRYPIAEKAAKLLLAQASLNNDAYKRVIESLQKTDNNDVRLTLLRSMVKHGSPSHRDMVVKIAIGEGKPTYQRLSAEALYFQNDDVEDRQLDLIADEDVATVSPAVACWLVLIFTARSSNTRILQLARSLAINPDRTVLITLIYLATLNVDRDQLNAAIGELLPANHRSTLNEIFGSGDTLKVDHLDDLGDVQTVEEVKSFIRAFIK